jgi:hypothetical protein
MIARNFRKYSEAMALQMVLPFTRLLVWATARPGVRILRTIRAERANAFKEAGRIIYPQPKVTPTWWKKAKARAHALAHQIKTACLPIQGATTA